MRSTGEQMAAVEPVRKTLAHRLRGLPEDLQVRHHGFRGVLVLLPEAECRRNRQHALDGVGGNLLDLDTGRTNIKNQVCCCFFPLYLLFPLCCA